MSGATAHRAADNDRFGSWQILFFTGSSTRNDEMKRNTTTPHRGGWRRALLVVTLLTLLPGRIEAEVLRVTIPTPEGQEQFVLNPLSPTQHERLAADGQELLRGTARAYRARRGAQRFAAATRVGRRLTIWFAGRRGHRFYRAELHDGKLRRLRRASGRASLRCGRATTSATASSGFADMALSSDQGVVLSPPRVLEISLDADYEFVRALGGASNAKREMTALLNAAEAIFMHQIGLQFQVKRHHSFSSRSQQPYRSVGSGELLEEFRAHAVTSKHLGRADAYHLFSGKRLRSGVLGIAYLGVTCLDGHRFSYSLSQRTNAAIHPLVVAHELAHNLGARHPEEFISPPPAPSLMTGIVRPSQSSFSQVSVGEIVSHIEEYGSCLGLAPEHPTLRAAYRQGVLRLTFTSQLESLAACEVGVYGADNARALRDPENRATHIAPSSWDGKTFAVQSPNALGTTRRRIAHFRVVLDCPGVRTVSTIASVRVPVPQRGGVKGWLRSLVGSNQ